MQHFSAFLCGFTVCLILTLIALTSYANGRIPDKYLPEFIKQPTVKYIDIGNDVPQIKLYLKQRLGLPGFSALLDSGCMGELLNVLQKRNAVWLDEYCHDAYSHLTMTVEDRYGSMVLMKWRID